MKSLVIAVTTLALAGVAYAQAEPQTAPADSASQVEDAAAAAAEDAAVSAAKAADAAAEAARDAAEIAGDVTPDAAMAADKAAKDAAAAADHAADDAALAADTAAGMAAETGEAATSAAEDAAEEATAEAGDEAAADTAGAVPAVVPPDVNPPAISEAEPGVLSSWVTSRRIWTTNQPSTTQWVDPMLQERPAEWQDIAKVNDIVLDDSGQVVGYIADIGGFLGIGAKKVLLGTDAIHLLSIGGDTFFATNYTKEELEALPDFDQKTVRN